MKWKTGKVASGFVNIITSSLCFCSSSAGAFRCSMPPAAPREDSAAGRVAHRLPQQPSRALGCRTPAEPAHLAREKVWRRAQEPTLRLPRHMRARLAPPPAASRLASPCPSASPPGGSIDAVAVATRGPGRVQSSRDSLACRPSGQNETTLCLYRGLASRFFGLTFQGIILAVND